MSTLTLNLPVEKISQACERYGVKRLWLFGSTARGEDAPHSDIDLLVEFLPGQTPGFIRFGELADELEEAFGIGREVDLVSSRALHPLVRPQIEKERVLLYEI